MKKTVLAFATACAMFAGNAHADQKNVLFVLDASNSMWGRIDGKPKIEIAKSVLAGLVKSMPAQTRMGLVAYGHRFDRKLKECEDMELLNPIGHFSAKEIANSFGFINPKGQTPIAGVLRTSASWLQKHKGQDTTVVLISDGVESCDGDPCAAAKALNDAGISTKIHVVGFDLSGKQRAALQCISANGNGRYFNAKDAGELKSALEEVRKEVEKPKPEPIKKVEAKPQPEPKPTMAVILEDSFDGSALAPHWKVLNENKDQYILEDGDLVVIGKVAGGFGNKKTPNLFLLEKDLPDGDWTVTIEFTPNFKTAKDLLSFGLYENDTSHIAGSLYAHDSFCCDTGNKANTLILVTAKTSGDDVTAFDIPVTKPHSNNRQNFEQHVEATGLNAKTTVQLVKQGRSYHARYHRKGQEDASGEPVWTETEKVTSIRAPKRFAVNAAQTVKNGGETLFEIHSFKVEAPQ